MISDRRRAVAAAEAAEEFIKQLSLALKAAQANGSAEELERMRKSIGEVVGLRARCAADVRRISMRTSQVLVLPDGVLCGGVLSARSDAVFRKWMAIGMAYLASDSGATDLGFGERLIVKRNF